MTVLRNAGRWDRSNVIYRDGQVVLYDKQAADPLPLAMQFIDYGISILSRDLVEQLPPAVRSDLAPILNRLSIEGSLADGAAKAVPSAVELFLVAAGDGHLHARAKQFSCRGEADAGRAADDDGMLDFLVHECRSL